METGRAVPARQALAAARRAFCGMPRPFAGLALDWAALAAESPASGLAQCMAAVRVSQAVDTPGCAAVDWGFVAASGAAQIGSVLP